MAHRGKAAPWSWADTVSGDRLMQAVTQFGYRPCNRCKPLAELQRQAARR